MKLLAQSCPMLENLKLRCSSLEKIIDPHADYEFDFDNDGLCAVANACSRHLYDVELSKKLHIGDLGVVSPVRSLKNLTFGVPGKRGFEESSAVSLFVRM
nr:hypothetical protein [Tanacetum cinerariifolium]